MELERQEIIEALLANAPQRVRRNRQEVASPAPTTTKPVSRVSIRNQPPVRCQCGRCFTCTDNAKWERIFKEKFADPTYYQGRVPSCGSSLASL